MSRSDGKDGRDPKSHSSEDPTMLPSHSGTATHAPVAEAGFADPTASAFATTRKVSTQALRNMVLARHGNEDSAPHLPPISAEFLKRLRRVRRQGMDAEGISFGPYTVFGLIGLGGMAQIRLAAESLPADGIRLVVIKSLLPEHSETAAYRELLYEEGRVCAQLHHPNIVQLYDQGEIDGIPYLAFELIDGVSVRDLVKLLAPARLPLSCILDLGAQMAAGLAQAHEAKDEAGQALNVVHRDVTPHNVLITRSGKVKLVDFGIARFEGRQMETKRGQLRGKLGYMAPEQCRVGPITGHADIFALSLTLTELIAGRRVLPPTLMILQESESLIHTACADAVEPVPDALTELLVKMAAIEPEARPWPTRNITRSLLALRQVVQGPSLAEFTQQRVFSRLLPLDFPSMTDSPTRRVQRLGTSGPPSEELLDDHYASTVRKLRPDPERALADAPIAAPPAPTRPAPEPEARAQAEDEPVDTAPAKPAIAWADTHGPAADLAAQLQEGASPTMPPASPWARDLQSPLPPDLDLPDESEAADEDMDVARTRRVSPLALPSNPAAPAASEPASPPSMGLGLWLGLGAVVVLAAAIAAALLT